jgi:4-hydroxybenzoate polyprenyltransferase
MNILQNLLRWASSAYLLASGGILMAAGAVAYITNMHTLIMPYLPWTGKELSTNLIYMGIGLALLAIAGQFRALRVLGVLGGLALAVLWGYMTFYSSHKFENPDQFQYFTRQTITAVTSFLASFASWWMGRRAGRR